MRDRNRKLAICLAAALALGAVAAPPSATAKKRKVIATTGLELTATRTGSNVISFTVRLDIRRACSADFPYRCAPATRSTRRACRGNRFVRVDANNELPVFGHTGADGTFSGSFTAIENPVGTRSLNASGNQITRQTKKLKLICATPQSANAQVELDPLPPEAP
jgi:hypothetical protein